MMRKKPKNWRETNWMDHYSAMDKEHKSIMGEFIKPNVNSKKKSLSINKKNLRSLLFIKNILDNYSTRKEEIRQARAITKIDPSEHMVDVNSTEAYVLRVLSKKSPLHITSIIDEMEKLGWSCNSKYHKYSRVSKAINDNYYMFMNVGKACFKIRDGFLGPNKKVEVIKPKSKKSKNSGIPTLKEIATYIAKKYRDKDGITASRVHYIMSHIGYNCSLSSVRRALVEV